MNYFYLIFIIFFLFFEFESGKIRPNFDEIFGNGWNKNETEEKLMDKKQSKIEQNVNSAFDQMDDEEMVTDPNDQMSECSDQNDTKSDQYKKVEPNDQRKREIIHKFDAIKEKLKQKGKYPWENNSKIEWKIGKLLGENREKIYKWKNEMNLNKNKMKKNFYEEKKQEFIERIDEFKSLYGQRKQKEFVKELGVGQLIFKKWKKELVPKYHKTQNKYSNDEKLKIMKQYFKMKGGNPKISDGIITKKLGVLCQTFRKWKKKLASKTLF